MIVVGLGTNLGSREAYLRAAELMLASDSAIEVAARSELYLTPPMGPPQPDYLNAALRLETSLHPRELLDRVLEIERRLGRVRSVRWGPRLVDIDLLYWSEGPIREPHLEVPHPGLETRPFAIAPLLDVAPELRSQYSCTPPPHRSWSKTPEDAADELDRLAFETTALLGMPATVTDVVAFEAELPAAGPAFIVLERWGEAGRRGSKLL